MDRESVSVQYQCASEWIGWLYSLGVTRRVDLRLRSELEHGLGAFPTNPRSMMAMKLAMIHILSSERLFDPTPGTG